ncbi:hypothetical protein RCL1_001964 [Eukaryota sp. TZLM3-RCL]
MSLNSEEINILIYRYLQEAGLHHTAFTLSQEALLWRSPYRNAEITPGSLISYLQKGLMYEEIETHLNADGTEKRCDQPFSLTQPHRCREVSEFETTLPAKNRIEPNRVAFLPGHEQPLLATKWCPSPKRPFILSSAEDGTARLWPIDARVEVLECAKTASERAIIVNHSDGMEVKNVMAIAWAQNGLVFATGCSDGVVRLFSIKQDEPKLLFTMTLHQDAIMAVSFNKKGDLFASASSDRTVIVWDTVSGQQQQIFRFHSQPVMDVQWRNDVSFSSASTDGSVCLCKLGDEHPKFVYKHKADVNVVSWDSAGIHLASASDDGTVRIWNTLSDQPLHTLPHNSPVFACQWRTEPKGQPGRVLATADADKTVRVWDTERGRCMHCFRFEEAIFCLSFSPDGAFLAVGGTRMLCVYDSLSGQLLRDLDVDSEVSDVSWAPDGLGRSVLSLCLPKRMEIALVEPFPSSN